jgi:hypothetical protein
MEGFGPDRTYSFSMVRLQRRRTNVRSSTRSRRLAVKLEIGLRQILGVPWRR